MSEPYIGEIRWFSFNFAPRGWAMCNGQTLQISQNQALYSIIGNKFGGDGKETFQLPNLQGRAVVHRLDKQFPFASVGGEEQHVLKTDEIPEHTHELFAGSDSLQRLPISNLWGTNPIVTAYTNKLISEKLYMGIQGLQSSGGDAPHENMQPYAVVNFCIALQGYYPERP